MTAASPGATGEPRLPTVLHLRSSGGLFGADRVVLDLCLELPGMGYRPLLVPLIEPGGVGEKLRAAALEAGVRVRPLALRHRFDREGIAHLRRLADIEGAEILHGHDYKTNILIRLAAPPAVHRVATLHGRVGTDWKLRLYETMESRIVRGFDRVICVSETMGQAERARGLMPVVVANGIDIGRFDGVGGDGSLPSSAGRIADLRRDLALPLDAEVVGAIGRLSREKGYDVLLRAVARLLPQRHRLHVLLVGDGPERERLRALGTSLGLGDRLHLPGTREDAPALYPLFDVFCLPSHREGLPLALLEAMAARRATVVTPVGGIPQVVGEGAETALIVAPGDVEGWTKALRRLLDDESLRVRLGAAARLRVEERFSRTRMARDVAHLYDALLGRAIAPPVNDGRR